MAPLLAFTNEHVRRLTGLSSRVLRYWEETGVYRASYVDEQPRRPYRRLYSFRDVVNLRALGMLRREHGVSLDELRKAGAFLDQHQEAPWTSLRILLAGRHVEFDGPETGGAVEDQLLGHAVIPIALAEIARATEEEAACLRKRLPEDYGRITRHRHINHNAWVIAGTRIPTTAILDFHMAGYSPEEIIHEYPQLRPEDVAAAIAHEHRSRKRLAA